MGSLLKQLMQDSSKVALENEETADDGKTVENALDLDTTDTPKEEGETVDNVETVEDPSEAEDGVDNTDNSTDEASEDETTDADAEEDTETTEENTDKEDTDDVNEESLDEESDESEEATEEDKEEAKDALESIYNAVNEAALRGGLTEGEAALATIAVECVTKRLKLKDVRMVASIESFSEMSSKRLLATNTLMRTLKYYIDNI